MRRALVITALLAAVWAALVGPPHDAPAATAPATPATRVIVVIAPYLSWEDVTPTSTPTLWRLASTGAVGDINARSRVRDQREPASPIEGALSISAGSWAVQKSDAPGAFSVSERFEIGTAAEAYRRTTGAQVGDAATVFLGLPATERLNAERSYEIVLGTLGEAVEDAGGVTAAIGNSDIGYSGGEQRHVRPAALAAMNRRGLVGKGDVSAGLLRSAPTQPFGIETDLGAFERRLAETLASVEESTPLLAVLDPGDLYRAKKFAGQVTDDIAMSQRSKAVGALDRVTEIALETDPDLLLVVSQSTGDPAAKEPEGIGPIIMGGRLAESGLLVSNSTQRPGLVTNPDVTATVLESMGIGIPVNVIGNQIRVQSTAETVEGRVDALSKMNATALAVDSSKPGVVNSFVAFTVAALALAAFVLVRGSHWSFQALRWWVRILQAALLLALALPVSGWLMFAWMRWPATKALAVIGVIATALAVWALALALWWKAGMRVPVAAISLLTVAVIIGDQWLGAPASFTNYFGYSPLLAARFYGLGNEGAAIVFGAAVVGLALLFDEWPYAPATRLGRLLGLPLIGTLVMVTAAAPFWGANVGVAIWGTIGFALAWFLINGHHVSWKVVFWLFLGVAVIIAGFAAIDLFGGGPQTHLGRALTSAEQGGLRELWQIVARKAETNARILTRTNWAYILVATLGFLGFMRWRPQGDFAGTLSENPYFADAVTVSLIAGLVAYFTEDSGIVIPALEVFYVGIALSWLMLARAIETGADAAFDGRGVERESDR